MKRKILSGLLFLTVIMLGSNVQAQTYCTVNTDYFGDYLNSISSNLAVTNFSYSASTAPTGSYSNQTALSFQSFETQTFEITTNYVGGGNGVNIWIDWNNDFTFDASEKVASLANSSASKTFSITVPTGQAIGDYRMRVRGQYGTTSNPSACGFVNWGSTVDFKLTLVAPPSCLPPTALVLTNTIGTSVDLGWTENNGSTAWNIEYGPLGFVLGSGQGSSVTSNPTTIPTTAGVEYDFYVQSNCGGGDLSGWAGPISLKYCGVSNLYGEYLTSVTSSAAVTNVNYSAYSQPAGSYANETAQTFESYETQTFTITTSYNGGGNGVNIWVDWNNDMVFDPSELVATGNTANASQTLSITVPAGVAQGDYRMRVRGEYAYLTGTPPPCGAVNYGSTVDFNLTIVSPPSCLSPTALTASNITGTTAELSWTENNGSSAWNLEYGVAGFGLGNGTPSSATNPATVTIAPNTSYEYYVQTDCGGGDLSSWAGPYAFDNIYCFPSFSSTSEYLSLVETSGAIADVSYTAASQPTSGYSDQTVQVIEAYETLTFDLNTVYNPSYGYALSVWVDWNNDFNFDASELMVAGLSNTGAFTQQLTIPAGTPPGNYRMRVNGVYGTYSIPTPCGNETWGSAVDFSLNIITAPSCLPPMTIDTVSVTTTSIELTWVELNSATSWTIEYGASGFTQGSGQEVTANSNPFLVTGLTPSANYDFYIQSDCGGNDLSSWRGPYSMYTACGIAVAPFYEGFNNGVQPQCWENLSSNTSTSIDNFWRFSGQAGYGAANNGRAGGKYAWAPSNFPNPDSMMMVSPEIDISQLSNPYLSFEWYSVNTIYPGDNYPLIVELFDGTSWNLLDTLRGDSTAWLFQNYDLSAYANNTIKVRFMVNQSANANANYYNDILVDEFRVDDCPQGAGTDGSYDVCRLDGSVNLEDNIIVKPNGGGTWAFPSQPAYLYNDTMFNVSNLPSGSFEVLYLERFVCYDTTFATINVFNPSSAGMDGSITVCKNAPIDLYSALSGNVDMGGDWYDFNGTLLTTAQPKAQSIPGQYNFDYIVTNGVCPADSAIVEVSVKADCDHLSVGEELFTDISVFPNPATSQLNILNPSNTSSLRVEMLDMNGRVVLVENKALNNASETTLVIDHLERGIYTLRVYNNEGQKTFKIVKQ